VCYIPDDVLIEFGPPDDEHLLLETCRGINKYIKKECIKLVITQNSYSKFSFISEKVEDLMLFLNAKIARKGIIISIKRRMLM
jgi:hypothetical protein